MTVRGRISSLLLYAVLEFCLAGGVQLSGPLQRSTRKTWKDVILYSSTPAGLVISVQVYDRPYREARARGYGLCQGVVWVLSCPRCELVLGVVSQPPQLYCRNCTVEVRWNTRWSLVAILGIIEVQHHENGSSVYYKQSIRTIKYTLLRSMSSMKLCTMYNVPSQPWLYGKLRNAIILLIKLQRASSKVRAAGGPSRLRKDSRKI